MVVSRTMLYRKMFRMFDKNEDGTASKQEVLDGLESVCSCARDSTCTVHDYLTSLTDYHDYQSVTISSVLHIAKLALVLLDVSDMQWKTWLGISSETSLQLHVNLSLKQAVTKEHKLILRCHLLLKKWSC